MDRLGRQHDHRGRKVRERIRRPDFGHLEIEVTVDDPKAYTKRPFMPHVVRVFLFVTLVWGAAATPAAAQVDFSGVWAPIMHEDSIERAAGPDIGDFLGLPINDAARQRAEAWDAAADAAGAPVQAAPVHLRIPRRRQSSHLE